MIKVGNLKSGAKDIYIGRAFRGRKGSPLGNPLPQRTGLGGAANLGNEPFPRRG
jgi:hypothetical protein